MQKMKIIIFGMKLMIGEKKYQIMNFKDLH